MSLSRYGKQYGAPGARLADLHTDSLGKSSRAALENVYAQTSVLLDDLAETGGPGAFVTLQGIIDEIPVPNQQL